MVVFFKVNLKPLKTGASLFLFRDVDDHFPWQRYLAEKGWGQGCNVRVRCPSPDGREKDDNPLSRLGVFSVRWV